MFTDTDTVMRDDNSRTLDTGATAIDSVPEVRTLPCEMMSRSAVLQAEGLLRFFGKSCRGLSVEGSHGRGLLLPLLLLLLLLLVLVLVVVLLLHLYPVII